MLAILQPIQRDLAPAVELRCPCGRLHDKNLPFQLGTAMQFGL
jgi:hypothetical protein